MFEEINTCVYIYENYVLFSVLKASDVCSQIRKLEFLVITIT